MIKRHSPRLSLTLIFSLLVSPILGAGQPLALQPQSNKVSTPSTTTTPTPEPAQTVDRDDDVVRITTNLVQVDATVTDKNGEPVTDLRPEDFTVYENGKEQPITNFSYITTESSPTVSPPEIATSPADKKAPPVPPARLRREQVQRTIALVVDDLGLSFESTAMVRNSLKSFIEKQMQPGDLTAIIRTSAGVGALQQFTSDKRQLHAAIERVKWYPAGRSGISAFAPLESIPPPLMGRQTEEGDLPSRANGERESREANRALDEFREEIFAVGTLGALNFVVRGLRELPGRKSVVLFSEGFTLSNRNEQNYRTLEALRRLTDLANRASVVFYTIDARGLVYTGLTAADDTSGRTINEVLETLSNRSRQLFETQGGLNYLAQQTGGFSVLNNNDLSGSLRRVLNEQKGYYLIGYRPDAATFDPATGGRRYHKFALKVKRPGLKVRTRSGFYGFPEEDARPVRRTREEQMYAALTSPFSTNGVGLRLTSFFSNQDKIGSFMRSLLHIDGRDLTFKEEADGTQKAVIDVIAVTFGDSGRVLDQVNNSYTLRTRGEAYQSLLRDGLVYRLNVPVKKHGAYQLRVAVRDGASERVGSASQFVEVPDLGKDRLALSGVILNRTAGEVASPAPATPTPGANASASNGASPSPPGAAGSQPHRGTNGADDAADPQANPSVRRFRQGSQMDYYFIIFNAKFDRATNQPQLQTQVRLFRDGQPVFTGTAMPYRLESPADKKRLIAGGTIRLGTQLTPGEYILQVVVTDLLAKEKYRIATQWSDFEIVK